MTDSYYIVCQVELGSYSDLFACQCQCRFLISHMCHSNARNTDEDHYLAHLFNTPTSPYVGNSNRYYSFMQNHKTFISNTFKFKEDTQNILIFWHSVFKLQEFFSLE